MQMMISILLLAFVAMSPVGAQALPVVDQSSEDISLVGFLSNGWQQGVTVGLTGQLTGIAIYTTGPSTTLSIYSGQPWQAGSAMATVSSDLNVGWNLFDLAGAGLYFNAGDQFTWSANGASGFIAGSTINNGPYNGGIAVFEETNHLAGEFDLAFRSYVEPAVVLEPGSFAILAIGLATFGRLRRRTPC